MQYSAIAIALAAFGVNPAALAEESNVRSPAFESVQVTAMSGEERLSIDGRIDEPLWSRAVEYPVAHQYAPLGVKIDIPRTTYRLVADRHDLYVAVRCDDPDPAKIWRALAHRDAITIGDIVSVYIDPSGERRFAQLFRVSAGGAVRDGTYYEHTGKVDIAPDYAFESATRVDASGWTAEFKIPASALRLTGQRAPTILITRNYPRAYNFTFASTPIDAQHHCIVCRNAELKGLEGMERTGAVTAVPYVSIGNTGGDLGSTTKGRAGVDVKWRISDASVADLTIWPDFSQVELDVPQLAANTTTALFYPEKRPFFLEGLDLFDTPFRAAYTRTITKPQWGARITHRGDGDDALAIVARDEGGGLILLPTPWRTNFARQPMSTAAIARARFAVLGTTSGAVAALKDYGDSGQNLVGGIDTAYTSAANRLSAQVLLSRTTALYDTAARSLTHGDAESDSAVYGGWRYSSNNWIVDSSISRVGEQFRDDSGFVEVAGRYSGASTVTRRIDFPFGRDSMTNKGYLYVVNRYKQTLDGQTIASDVIPGIGIDRGSTHWEAFVTPWSTHRIDATSELHRLTWVQINAEMTPARWLPSVDMEFEFGDQLDTFSDRVGSGYRIAVTPSFLIRERLRIAAQVSQLQIFASQRDSDAAPDDQSQHRRTLLRDTVGSITASYFFDAANELRATYQYRQTVRDQRAFTAPIRAFNRSEVVSVVYTWMPSIGRAFYAGGTWSSAESSAYSEGTELFVKFSWLFD